MLARTFRTFLGDWQCVDKVEALACSEIEKQAILEGNAGRLLKISAS